MTTEITPFTAAPTHALDKQSGPLKTKRDEIDPVERVPKPGETDAEILQMLRDLRAHKVDMLTFGQYLQPSGGHMPVRRDVHPNTFKMYAEQAARMGFLHAASGPLVRSSHHADEHTHAVFGFFYPLRDT